MGGIGKTELALQYALADTKKQPPASRSYPGGICWINAAQSERETPEKASDLVGIQILNFARLYLQFNLPEEGELGDRVRYCWLNWRQGDVLVIFDDVAQYEAIASYLPPQETRFKVIITTRQQYLTTTFESLHLEALETGAALNLLAAFIGAGRLQEESEAAQQLCRTLGYLPLGIELVGRFLKRKPKMSLAEMQEKLATSPLTEGSLREVSPEMTARRGVEAAFDLSWQELNPEARQLGCFLSLFAPSPIPWSLVEESYRQPHRNNQPGIWQKLFSPFAKLFPRQQPQPLPQPSLSDIRDSLLNLNLLEDRGKETYEFHSLLREFFRLKLAASDSTDTAKQQYCQTLIATARQIEQTLTISDVAALAPLIPHLTIVAETLTSWLADEDLIWAFVGLARYYEGQGLYDAAAPWYEQCLTVTRKRLGEEHPAVATSLNNE